MSKNTMEAGFHWSIGVVAHAMACALLGLIPQAAVAAQPVEAANRVAQQTARINTVLNLRASTLVQLSMPSPPVAGVTVTVPIQGQPQSIDLQPNSVRSDRYEVEVQLADGSYVNVAPPLSHTLQGTVLGIDGSVAAGSLLPDGLYARIILPDGDTYWIEPVASRLPGAAPNEHVVYRSQDVIPGGGTCLALPVPHSVKQTTGPVELLGTGNVFTAELAVDADFEYFLRYGTVQATITQIEKVINIMNIQYVRDVAITHMITTVIVRTAEPDPYTSTDPGTLLNQFRSHWQSQQSGVQRDTAELFTGKNINGSVIGIAWVGSICSTSFGYSVVQSDFSGTLSCKTDLSAHELGHNWSALHCNCSSWTMNPGITCANRFHPTFTIPDILTHRNSRSCLQVGPIVCAGSQPPHASATAVPKNRYLSFAGSNPGQLTAVRVTFVDLPAPFDVANGQTMWLGEPQQVSQSPGIADPAGAPGSPTFTAATLQCDPFYDDWSTMGDVEVYHQFVVPGGSYALQEIDVTCALSDATAFSAPFPIATSIWGDVVENCTTTPCLPPDGSVDVTTDVVSILNTFADKFNAPSKVRADLEPATPDRVINITDVVFSLGAFAGQSYPFVPTSLPCP